ncbi:hypothetical protein [Pseudonocardia sp.]|uniref:hypothetical protein n=1 Tax=Pseudonocardia sp. TaxID=60912 RepID=UPI00262EB5C2|nr:hypothetical protein [Pseudonocardia sp.]
MSVLALKPARHRRSSVRDTLVETLDVIGRLGTVVTLAALLVVGARWAGCSTGARRRPRPPSR